jgi:acetyltransferase-like isoleucine patch superfamily enzyme
MLLAVIRELATLMRWCVALATTAAFGRPREIGRGLRVGRGVRIGKGVTIGVDVRIEGDVTIGDNVTLESGALLLGAIKIGPGTCIGRYTYVGTGPAGRLSIGADVQVNDHSTVTAMESLTIEDHCIFAPHLQITDSEHGLDRGQHIKHAPIRSDPVSVGEGVWLGSHVVVLKGSRIGARSVVGAHSLVNGAIAADSVAFGIPARVRRMR